MAKAAIDRVDASGGGIGIGWFRADQKFAETALDGAHANEGLGDGRRLLDIGRHAANSENSDHTYRNCDKCNEAKADSDFHAQGQTHPRHPPCSICHVEESSCRAITLSKCC